MRPVVAQCWSSFALNVLVELADTTSTGSLGSCQNAYFLLELQAVSFYHACTEFKYFFK